MSDTLFTPNDLKLIESLTYDPTLKPNYHPMKGCLIWDDEKIDNLTSSAYEAIGDLWIARSYIHRGLDFSNTLDPAYFQNVWDQASQLIPTWPGFNRLYISDEDRAFFEAAMQEMSDAEEQGLEY